MIKYKRISREIKVEKSYGSLNFCKGLSIQPFFDRRENFPQNFTILECSSEISEFRLTEAVDMFVRQR